MYRVALYDYKKQQITYRCPVQHLDKDTAFDKAFSWNVMIGFGDVQYCVTKNEERIGYNERR